MPRRPIVHASPLDEPAYAARVWARYRRMMRLTGELALGSVAAVWVILYHEFGLVSIHLYIASGLGLGLTIMMIGALMGLVFLSHDSGHDAAIDDPFEDDHWGK